MTDEPPAAATTSTSPATPVRRGRAWILVLLGGLVATVGGTVSLVTLVVAALDGTRSAPVLWPMATFVLGIVVGGFIASRGFGFLGVRRGVRSGLLGALVGVVGVLAPWVVAAVAGRLGS